MGYSKKQAFIHPKADPAVKRLLLIYRRAREAQKHD
jgi:hypothetical protein